MHAQCSMQTLKYLWQSWSKMCDHAFTRWYIEPTLHQPGKTILRSFWVQSQSEHILFQSLSENVSGSPGTYIDSGLWGWFGPQLQPVDRSVDFHQGSASRWHSSFEGLSSCSPVWGDCIPDGSTYSLTGWLDPPSLHKSPHSPSQSVCGSIQIVCQISMLHWLATIFTLCTLFFFQGWTPFMQSHAQLAFAKVQGARWQKTNPWTQVANSSDLCRI